MDPERLFEVARQAMERCHAPYSDFPVGAAIGTAEGQMFAGANIEVASFPEGWCAETTALGHYVMGGGGTITDIVVVASKMDRITPCGGCRQRLAEFAGPQARLHLCDQNGIVETLTMEQILPLGFRGDTLR